MFASRSFLPMSLAASFISQPAFADEPNPNLPVETIKTDVNVEQAPMSTEAMKIREQILFSRLKPDLVLTNFSPDQNFKLNEVQLPSVKGYGVNVNSYTYSTFERTELVGYRFVSSVSRYDGEPCDKNTPYLGIQCVKVSNPTATHNAIFDLAFDVSSDSGMTYCNVRKSRQNFQKYEHVDWSHSSELGDRIECSGPLAVTDAVELFLESSHLYLDQKPTTIKQYVPTIDGSMSSGEVAINLFAPTALAGLGVVILAAAIQRDKKLKEALPILSVHDLMQALQSSLLKKREQGLALLRTLIRRGHEDGNTNDDVLNNLDLNQVMAELISYCRVELLSWKSNAVLVDCLRAIEMIVESHPEKIRLKDELKSVLQSRSGLWRNDSRVAYLARSISQSLR